MLGLFSGGRAGRRSRSVAQPKPGLLLLLLGVLAATGAFGLHGASATQMGGKFVVVGDSSDPNEYQHDGLYVLNADGSGLRQITHSSSDAEPHWSPDGHWIAYQHHDGAEDAVSIVRDDGSKGRVLGWVDPYSDNLDTPSPWSPDGKQLAWNGCGGLCIFDLARSHRRSTTLGDNASGFSWSPDGHELAAASDEGVVTVSAADGAIRTVLAAAGGSPAWSRDGRWVAFDVGSKLEVVPAAGGAVRTLARYLNGRPVWSPRGHRLLFVARSSRFGAAGLWVSDLAAGHPPRLVATDADAAATWSPDGTIAFTRSRGFLEGSDVWRVRPDGGTARQVTNAFPTGVGYQDPDWTSGSLPVPPQANPEMVALTPSTQLQVEWLDGLSRSGTPDSVAYTSQTVCDPDAETTSNTFFVWTPSTGSVDTADSGCNDFGVSQWALTPTLAAWLICQCVGNGQTMVSVARFGSETDARVWSTASNDAEIGYENELGGLSSDGSMLTFETHSDSVGSQLWRIADGSPPHAVPIPLPADATNTVDEANGRIALSTRAGGLVVVTPDGTVVCRLPPFVTRGRPAEVKLGDDLLGTITGTTLNVYHANDASPLVQLPLAHASGPPHLLAVGNSYAAYVSGIELHLLRLGDGLDQILELAGQAGPVGALLTSAGLFVSYDRAYDPKPGRILFVAASALP